MNRFAKLFEVGDSQVLVYMEHRDQGENGPEKSLLRVITSVNGIRADMNWAYDGEDQERKLKKAFEKYDQNEAVQFLKAIEKTLS